MVFSGVSDETLPRLIYDNKRPVLRSGNADSFLMTVPRSLGALTYIRY